MELRVLAVGDVVGEGGLDILSRRLPGLKEETGAHFAVVNGENASGVGITPAQARRILEAGADVITLGNHTWNRIQIGDFLDKEPRVYVGHNPLAQAGMAVGMVFMLIIMLSGLGLYAQSAPQSPIFRPFLFMLDLMYWVGGNDQELRSLHRLGMLLLVTFVTVHIYMVIREEIMGKTTLVSTMISGFRERRRS